MKCRTEIFTVGRLMAEKNVININPPYQREAGIWSPEKRSLFIDSLFNKYDTPKLYLHGIGTGRYDYAVIDGKQRLTTIWDFLDNKIQLPDSFSLSEKPRGKAPKPKSTFKGLTEQWQEVFKSRALDVVVVENAHELDIEELFSRLNNGEALNAAEKRNAMGGEMCKLIREVSQLPFFKEKVAFTNKRFQHLETAAKFILIEKTNADSGDPYCDLKKRFLDRLVEGNATLSRPAKKKLKDAVTKQLKTLGRDFSKKDPHLKKQAYSPLYYLFVKEIVKKYAKKTLHSDIKKFIGDFNILRQKNLDKDEEKRDPVLINFGRLMQQGTNDLGSLKERVSILTRHFLAMYPDVSLKDKRRQMNHEERLAAYDISKHRCHKCKTPFGSFSDFEADHVIQWSHGGPTSLANARALCSTCNNAIKEAVS